MSDEENETTPYDKAETLLGMLETVKVKFNRPKADEMLYTLCESGVIDGSYDSEFAEIFFKVFTASNILTDEQIAAIRL